MNAPVSFGQFNNVLLNLLIPMQLILILYGCFILFFISVYGLIVDLCVCNLVDIANVDEKKGFNQYIFD